MGFSGFRTEPSTVSSALSTQISELDNAIGQKQAEIDSLNSQLLQAARFCWADRFERAALELGTLATHLSAVEKLLGRGDDLADFYIPTVSPTKSNFISHRRIMDQRSNINLD